MSWPWRLVVFAAVLVACVGAQTAAPPPPLRTATLTLPQPPLESATATPTNTPAGTAAPTPTLAPSPRSSLQRFDDWWTRDRIIIVVVSGATGVVLLVVLVLLLRRRGLRVIGVMYLSEAGKWVHEEPPPPPGGCAAAPSEAERARPTAVAPAVVVGPSPPQSARSAPASIVAASAAPQPVPTNPYPHVDNIQAELRKELLKNDTAAVARDMYRMKVVVAKPDGTPNAPMGFAPGDFKARNAAMYHTLSQTAALVGEDATVGQHLAATWSATVVPADAADISAMLLKVLDVPAIVSPPSKSYLILRGLHQGLMGTATNYLKAALWQPWNDPAVFTTDGAAWTTTLTPLPGTSHVFVRHHVSSISAVAACAMENVAERKRTPQFTIEWSVSMELDTLKADADGLVSANVVPSQIRIAHAPPADPSDASVLEVWNRRVDELRMAVDRAFGVARVAVTVDS